MADANRSVPFVAMNGCMREDFLHRVLHRAIEFLPQASAPGAATMRTALRSIAVPGFRQVSRAPLGLQARAAISQFRISGEFVGAALDVWTESQPTLASYINAFLEKEQIPQERIKADTGQFADRWSLDKVLELAERFRAEHEADKDEVALMLCCLTNRAPVEETPPPAADEPKPTPTES